MKNFFACFANMLTTSVGEFSMRHWKLKILSIWFEFCLTPDHFDWSVQTDWGFSLAGRIIEAQWKPESVIDLCCVLLPSLSYSPPVHFPPSKEFLLFIFWSPQSFFFPITIWSGSFLCNNTGHESGADGPSRRSPQRYHVVNKPHKLILPNSTAFQPHLGQICVLCLPEFVWIAQVLSI